jgi:hemoglobin-like flavoprotein
MSDQPLVDAATIQLLEDSFVSLGLHRQILTERFYENLFAARPDFKPLFGRVSVDDQESKLHKALMLATQNLRKPDKVYSYFQALGQRHQRDYHIQADYYAVFVEVLHQTLGEIAEDKWTPELSAAWQEALAGLAEIMKSSGGA